jgi:hypothetical protein
MSLQFSCVWNLLLLSIRILYATYTASITQQGAIITHHEKTYHTQLAMRAVGDKQTPAFYGF